MRCPKCGYISFDHLISCGKCGVDLADTAAQLKGTGISAQPAFFLGGVARTLEEDHPEDAGSEDPSVELYEALASESQEAGLLDLGEEEAVLDLDGEQPPAAEPETEAAGEEMIEAQDVADEQEFLLDAGEPVEEEQEGMAAAPEDEESLEEMPSIDLSPFEEKAAAEVLAGDNDAELSLTDAAAETLTMAEESESSVEDDASLALEPAGNPSEKEEEPNLSLNEIDLSDLVGAEERVDDNETSDTIPQDTGDSIFDLSDLMTDEGKPDDVLGLERPAGEEDMPSDQDAVSSALFSEEEDHRSDPDEEELRLELEAAPEETIGLESESGPKDQDERQEEKPSLSESGLTMEDQDE